MGKVVLLCFATSLTTLAMHEVGLLGVGTVAARIAEGRARIVVLAVAVGIVLLHLAEIGLYTAAIAVLHLGQEIEVLPVPQQPGFGRRPRRPLVLPQPGQGELVDHLGMLPGRIVGLAVDDDRNAAFNWYGALQCQHA